MGGVVGAVTGAYTGSKALKEQERAMRLQQKAAEEQIRLQKMADMRERRRMLREAAIARGRTVNISSQIGGGAGPTAGTALVGGLAGLQGQVLSGLGFQQTSQTSAAVQQRFLNKAAKAQMDASKWIGIGQGLQSLAGFLPSPRIGTPFGSFGL